ncbi:MAG: VWA domain-containing protein [Candidatus Azotimanducaceae bacterium WSBS_2022_MAG_OTU7]
MNDALLTDILANFHFLRPEWFYALIPAVLLFTLLRYRQSHHSNWEKAIDPHLLPHILDNPNKVVSKSPLSLLLFAWILATIAISGPVWRKTAQPVHEREDALVVILDLTRSMLATDVKPNRLVRAKRKLIDLLELREEGVTALIVFAGDAHVVSPLTDDTKTIAAMIPALSPDIVPAPGSALAPALVKAVNLFRDGGTASGRILIITDEIRDVVASQRVVREYRNTYPVSVMSVGTPEGAPVAMVSGRPEAGFLKDARGNMVVPNLNAKSLKDFADLAGGRYSPMTLTEEDLAYLLAEQPLAQNDAYHELERDFDVWFEEGPWLLLLLLPLAALGFRRGWVWGIALVLILPTEDAKASLWDDLWKTRDQQALQAMAEGDVEAAAGLFENPEWKATANYRSENFEDAASQYGGVNTADAKYNLGNAFAKQGLLDEAIEAYDQALTLDPASEDAQFNKALVVQLLEQLKEQQENQDQDGEESEYSEGQQGEEQEATSAEEQEDSLQELSEEEKAQQEEDQEEEEEGEEQTVYKPAEEETDPLDEEEKQALQQWLRRVPDEPGGLLRRKFQMQYEERLREGKVSSNDSTTDW